MRSAHERGLKEVVKGAVRGVQALPAWSHRLGYYALALLFVAVAAVLRWELRDVLSPAPTMVFYLAWVGAAAFGGLGPGLLATVASWLCIEFLFDSTAGQIGFTDPTSIARLFVLLAGGLAVSVVGEKMRRTRTREREQEQALRKSEERLRQRAEEVETLMDLVPMGIWVANDPQCDQIIGNRAANRLYEALDHENVSANVSPARRFFRDGQEIKPEELPMQEAAAKNIDIRDAEVDVLLPSGVWRNMFGSASPLYDAEGRVRGCVGAFMDITARKQAEEALRESEERYHRFFEDDLAGDYISTPEGRILVCNPAFAEMFGFSSAQEAVGTSILDLYPDPAERESLLERLTQEGKIGRFGVWRKRRDGEPIHIVENLVGHFNDQGQLYEIKGYLFEDTERKQAEEALRQSEEFSRRLIESSFDCIKTLDLEGNLLSMSTGGQHLLDIEDLPSLLNTSWIDFWKEQDRPRVAEAVAAARAGGVGRFQAYCPTGAGRPKWWDVVITPIRDASGQVERLLSISRDITDRRQAEEAVAESRKRYQGFVEKINDWVWETDADGVYTYSSPRALELLGYPPEEIVGRTPFDFMPPAEAERVWNAFRSVWLERRPLELLENTLMRKDGRLVTVETSGMPMFAEDGSFRGYTGVDRDVTSRKQAEQALRERMKELACLYAVSRDIQEGLSIDELCRRAVEHLVSAMRFPEITVAVIELNGKRFTSENYSEGLSHGLHAAIRVEGEVLGHLRVYYTQERPFIIPEEQNLVNGVAEALSVWLEHKQAEEALQRALADAEEGRNTLHALMEYIPMGITIADAPDVNIRMVSKHGQNILERAESEIAHIPAPEHPSTWGIYHADGVTPGTPEDLPLTRATVKGEVVRNEEWIVTRKDGTLVPILCNAAPIRDEEGNVVGGVIGWQDITALKESERQREHLIEQLGQETQALAESEERYRIMGESVDYGVWAADVEGKATYISPSFCELVGRTFEEIRQFGWLDTLVPEQQQEVVDLWLHSVRTGEPFEHEHHFVAKDGSIRIVLARGSPIRDASGDIASWAGINLDITERKRAEEALRELTATLESKVAQRTSELKHRARQLQKMTLDMSEAEDRERRRLAEILHDDLQQMLAAAKFHVGLMRNEVRHDPSLQSMGAEIDQMLREAIEKTRSLSHELSPAVLHHGDLGETLEWLAKQVQAKHGLVVHVHAHGDVRSQSDTVKAFLYKVAQELLFNVVKHARAAEARIRVRRLGRCICLSVSDRGRGFDVRELEKATGFGLLSIRERIELLGGRIKIRSAKGKGSTFLIAVPDGEVPEVEPESSGRAGSEDSGRLRVLLADDHDIVREGLASLLGEESDVEVIGGASNGREAVDLADRLKPDVVIMDVSMPIMTGDEATRQIKQHLPNTRVVALSMSEDANAAERMHAAGAEAYVLKTAPSEELLAAIRGRE